MRYSAMLWTICGGILLRGGEPVRGSAVAVIRDNNASEQHKNLMFICLKHNLIYDETVKTEYELNAEM